MIFNYYPQTTNLKPPQSLMNYTRHFSADTAPRWSAGKLHTWNQQHG